MAGVISIVGGGMVGASLALALQRSDAGRDWRIRLIEALPPAANAWQPSYDARSTALSWGSSQLLRELGVWSQLAERAEPIRHIHVSDRGHPGMLRMHAEQEGVPALGYVVENAWLGQVLLGALDQQRIDWLAPARVTALQPADQGYRLQVEGDGQSHWLDTDLLVLADGGRSGLLEQLGIQRSARPYGQTAIIANVSTSRAHQGEAFERFTADGPMALLPLVEQRSALVWTLPEDQARQVLALTDAAFLRRLQEAFGYRLGELLRVGERSSYPLQLIESDEQVRPHLVVLGNAAHSLHPIAGQGFNLSLRDAMALARHIRQAWAEQAAPGELARLQAYLAEQRDDQRLTIDFSDRLTRLFSNRQPLLEAGRTLGLLGLDLLAPAKSLFARRAMGLRS